MKKLENTEKERFISEIEKLINSDTSLNYSNIAQSVGYNSQDFTDIKSGKKKVQRNFLDAIAEKYTIDKVFILTGKRNIDTISPNDDINQALRKENEFLRNENSLLKENIEIQKKYIAVLEGKSNGNKSITA